MKNLEKSTKTVIEDPVLEPYFIYKDKLGSWCICKRTATKSGYREICYPSSFLRCLERIAQEQLEDSNDHYTLQEFIDTWKQVSDKIINAYQDWDIKKI